MNEHANHTLTVGLGERSYPIEIGHGVLERLPHIIGELSEGGRTAIITDENVNAQHGDVLRAVLDKAGIEHCTLAVAPGEASKSWSIFQQVVEELLSFRLERQDLVIAFGGGVVGDLAGFAASVVRRGMRFVQIPTSLLAQVDSSVGGKTGINSASGKNLVGAFHQPSHVLIDLDFLRSLPAREFRAGYAEVVKYGLIGYSDFFDALCEKHEEIFAFGPMLETAIAQSCQAKAEIVAADETEKNKRALLNLGHTFGHALEGFTSYDGKRLVHGEGVAIGMMLAHQFSNRLNLCSMDDVQRVETHLKAVGLPTRIQDIPGEQPSVETLMSFIEQDKKVSRGRLTFILTKGVGQAYIANDVQAAEVAGFLKDKIGS